MSITARNPKRLRYTLDSETYDFLKQRRDITSPTNRGLCTIRVAAYSPVLSSASEDSTDFPVYVESPATLELAGFSRSAAEEVFTKYESLCEELPELCLDLEKVTCEWIHAKARAYNACSPSDDYASAWLAMGVDQERVGKLMSEELRTERLRYSASEAFKYSVNAIFDYVHELGRSAKHNKTLLEARADSPSSSPSPSPAIRSRPNQRSLPSNQPEPTVETTVDFRQKLTAILCCSREVR